MEKIIVFGNNTTVEWLRNKASFHFEMMLTNVTLNEDGERKIVEYAHSVVTPDTTCLIIDADSIINDELCLAFSMAVRLSLAELGRAALVPIIFVTDSTLLSYKGNRYSQLVLTEGIYFESRVKALLIARNQTGLSFDTYFHGFLDRIKLYPNANEGRHSLANQWGADVLNRALFGGSIENELIKKARLSLYFRYVQALSYSPNEISDITRQETKSYSFNYKPLNAVGKRIMLIDDEADKGWADVLKGVFAGAEEFSVYCEKVPGYSYLSEAARSDIESGRFDLFLLDLRMNGVSEEDNMSPDQFSGMKILKQIKDLNRGNQVIMLTASNKAWNMKALFDEGADGYYIKESPEYVSSIDQFSKNAQSLISVSEKCLKESNSLRNIWDEISKMKKVVGNNNLANKYFLGLEVMRGLTYQGLISDELDIVWNLLISNNKKKNQFVILSLYKILEYLCEFFYEWKNGKLCFISKELPELQFIESGVWYNLGQKVPSWQRRIDKITQKPHDSITKRDLEATTTKVNNIMRFVKIPSKDVSYEIVKDLGNKRNQYIHSQNSTKNNVVISFENINDWLRALSLLFDKL